MASESSQDNEPISRSHPEFFEGAQNTTMRNMNVTTHNGERTYYHDASTYHGGAVRNQVTQGGTMTVNMPSPAQPVLPQSHSRSSSSTRSSTRATADRYPAPSYYEAPRGANTLGAVPQNPYGSRHPGYHQQYQQESSPPTPQGWADSIDGGWGPRGLLALARDDPRHPQPDDRVTPPQLASPGLESLSRFGVSSLLRGPGSLVGSGDLSPDDSRLAALRPPEEAEVDRRSVSTPPAPSPQVARPDVEERVQPPAPAALQTTEDSDKQPAAPAASAYDGPQAEQLRPPLEDGGVDVKAEEKKAVLEVGRSTPLDQRTPASGALSLDSPSRAHFNSGPSVDDQSSISDESEPDAETLTRANAVPAAPEGVQPKLGVVKRFRFWLSRMFQGLARMVAPSEV